MAKRLITFSLFLLSTSALADVTTAIVNVTNCLTGSSTAAGSKGQCIQAAITTEQNNQIATLFQTYASFINVGLTYYASQAPGVNTPNTPGNVAFGSQAGGLGSSATTGGTNAFVPPKSSGKNTIQAPAPVPQSPGAPAPKQTPGGIQYY